MTYLVKLQFYKSKSKEPKEDELGEPNNIQWVVLPVTGNVQKDQAAIARLMDTASRLALVG